MPWIGAGHCTQLMVKGEQTYLFAVIPQGFQVHSKSSSQSNSCLWVSMFTSPLGTSNMSLSLCLHYMGVQRYVVHQRKITLFVLAEKKSEKRSTDSDTTYKDC